jgi:hypothetical protein
MAPRGEYSAQEMAAPGVFVQIAKPIMAKAYSSAVNRTRLGMLKRCASGIDRGIEDQDQDA